MSVELVGYTMAVNTALLATGGCSVEPVPEWLGVVFAGVLVCVGIALLCAAVSLIKRTWGR